MEWKTAHELGNERAAKVRQLDNIVEMQRRRATETRPTAIMKMAAWDLKDGYGVDADEKLDRAVAVSRRDPTDEAAWAIDPDQELIA